MTSLLAVAHSVTLLVPLVVLCTAAGLLLWEPDERDDTTCARFRDSRRAARRVSQRLTQPPQTDGMGRADG